MRAAVLHAPDDLRVEDVAEPEGEVLVRVEAATACGTDVKMLRHGHRVLGPYPSRFGHETAGVRLDTGAAARWAGGPPASWCSAAGTSRSRTATPGAAPRPRRSVPGRSPRSTPAAM